MRIKALLLLCLAASEALAQLTAEQRVIDFQALVSLYAKRYAPATWKKQLTGFDLFDVSKWMDRVRNAKDDLEYLEIASEYVAQLDDLHSSFRIPSNFFADAGVSVDIYDGKVLIEAINRTVLPADRFPFAVGDELVSVDGTPVGVLLDGFEKLRRRGNPVTTRRANANLLTLRSQSVVPRAVDVGDEAVLVIRRAETGEEETFTVPWRKTGVPLRNIGPVPDPKWKTSAQRAADAGDYMAAFRELTNFRAPEDDHLITGGDYLADDGQLRNRKYLLGYGARAPVFTFPQGFTRRKGAGTDFLFTGVYQSEGTRIGYIRFPSFSPNNYNAALAELIEEVAFFQRNTDGLVVDVMRNTGGGCYMLDAAAFLIPRNFYFFGEELRVTRELIATAELSQRTAIAQNAPQWIRDYYTQILDELQRAYAENRGMTQALPACNGVTQSGQPRGFEYTPASNLDASLAVYDKPMIILIDDFSTSAGDIFPAMLQDNKRGPLVGTRTNGAGGSISVWPTGFYSESLSSNTNSLVLRREPVSVPGYPESRYIENIGAHADVPLDYMTRENLVNGGRPFVDAFTKILVEHVKASRQ